MREIKPTVRRSIELTGLVLLGWLIQIGQSIVMPIILSFFIAVMLMPVLRFLKSKKIPDIIGIVISLALALVVVAGILFFISLQMANLAKDWPQLSHNINVHWEGISGWLDKTFNLSKNDQMQIFQDNGKDFLKKGLEAFSGFAVSASSVFVFLGLIPIYTFLILFYRKLILGFVFLWFKNVQQNKVAEVIYETETMIKSYLTGLLIQITYITVLLGLALFIFGIKHALLIGIIFALLNLIPYVGALIGNILGVLLTLSSTPDLWQVITVLLIIAAVQFLDNNILMPKIVGSKVRINALVSIVGVFLGGALAGVSGMFLSLPILAVFKIIFDRTV